MDHVMPGQKFHFDRTTLVDLLKISLPMVVSQGAFAVMIFTDRYFLAQIDPTNMAAALGGGVACFFSFSLFSGILAYANALVAQYLGAKEFIKCSRVLSQGILMALLCIPFLILITLVIRNIFAGMGHAADQVELEKSYYTIMMMGSVFTLIKICLASFFSGIGKTKVVMICDVLGICLNIPLSYVMIFGKLGLPNMGIEGAAISTVISTVFAICLFLLFYLAKNNQEKFHISDSFHVDRKIIRRYLKLGFPSGMELFLNIAAFNLFLLMFQSYGIPEAASAAIVFNWDILSFVPMMGLNIAVMSLIGRSIGSRELGHTGDITTSGYILGLGYSAVLAILFISFKTELVEFFIFSEDHADEIRVLSTFMMVGLATYVLAEGILQVASGVLRGAGDTRWVMMASVSLHWLMLVAQYFIIIVLDIGPRASWVAFVCMVLAIAAVFVLRVRGAKWRDPDRLSDMMAE